jgi:hypothetical protein
MACPNRQQHILDRAERVPLATTWKADHVVIAGEPGSRGRRAPARSDFARLNTISLLPCEPARGPGDVSLFNVYPKLRSLDLRPRARRRRRSV